jgi:hypothetical protein
MQDNAIEIILILHTVQSAIFGKRSPPEADEHLQKPHNAGSRPEAQFFNTLLSVAPASYRLMQLLDQRIHVAAVTALRYANQTLRFDFSKILVILFRAILQTIT